MSRGRSWTIEPMELSRDLDGVLAVEGEAFTNPWTREMYEAELEHPGVSVIHVLRSDETGVIGFCSAWLVLDELHINNFAIRASWRHQGLGRALLGHVLEAAARAGAVRATLEVRESNTAACRLYELMGFTVTARRPGYYQHPVEDALILWRDGLSPAGSSVP